VSTIGREDPDELTEDEQRKRERFAAWLDLDEDDQPEPPFGDVFA
jgi:hypothetical protein